MEASRAQDVAISVRDLTVALPEGSERARAIEQVTFDLHRNEILCIVGESGSGKSITAHAIMGLLPGPQVRATGGQILFGGQDLLRLSPDAMRSIRGARIAMIFQEPMAALNPLMTVGNQIAEAIQSHRSLGREAMGRRVIELLTSVGLPDPALIRNAFPFRLSGGQRQRVMIAMALALEPEILIADEPTTALDVTTQAQILQLIRTIQAQRQMAVLFITHDFGVVADIANRVAVMQHGKIVEIGPAAGVLNRPQHAYTRMLIAAVPHLIPRAPASFAHASIMLRAEGVRKTFFSGWSLFRKRRRTVHAVAGVTLTLRRGETLGIVGESGSGKSTLARCIVRLIESDAGSVHFRGVDLMRLSRREFRPYRKHVQMVFQDPYGSLNPRRRVGRIVAEGPLAHGLSEAAAVARALELLALVGLDAQAAGRYPHEFSGGQRQRIGLARALALEPELLVADEPVSALDVSIQAQVLALLDSIRRRLDLAMLFITHDLRVAAQVCDSVAVMRNGEIVEFGPTGELFAAPRHPYTRELLDAVPGRGWTPPVDSGTAGSDTSISSV
jgi:peptide/nickel transport system ATP-binding protein